MPDLLLPWWVLALFFLIALTYASVGLGGGSAYTALMVILGFDAQSIPLIGLALNLIVTSSAAFYFIRGGYFRADILLPFLLASLPFSWYGGSLVLPLWGFQLVLLGSLCFVLARIYVFRETVLTLSLGQTSRLLLMLAFGAVFGMLAGITGIGGGIYLVPVIVVLGLGTIKEAAGCGAVFIWLNSLVGLASRLYNHSPDFFALWPIFVVAALGGWLGAFWGAEKSSPRKLEKLLGLVILGAVGMLAYRLLSGVVTV